MKVVVFTYDRFDTISTSRALEESGIDHHVVCHDAVALEKFVAAGNVKRERLLASNVPKGLANNRNWYINRHLEYGEWCLMLVDDWMQATELKQYDEVAQQREVPITTKNAGEWAAAFRHGITMKRFLKRALELRDEAARRGIDLAGFAGYDNALFRKKHWATNVLADGRALVYRKTHLRWDPNVQMVDDVCIAAQSILFGNGTLVNQWVLPKCKRYTAGAYGSIEQRMAQKLAECAYLVSVYEGLVRFAPKAGWPPGSHVKVVPTSPAKVAAIRARMQQQSRL